MNQADRINGLIKVLVGTYCYSPLPEELSKRCREKYVEFIPSFLKLNGDNISLCNTSGTQLCTGYQRIVVGDYGAYIEFSKEQARADNFIIKPGQEYRNSTRYNQVKYTWYITNDYSNVKIYHQKKEVPYADYKVGYYYVSVFEVLPSTE